MLPTKDRSPVRTQRDTGSPRLWEKGRVRDKGLTLSVSTDATEQVQNFILNKRLSLLGQEEKVSVQNNSSACDKHELRWLSQRHIQPESHISVG